MKTSAPIGCAVLAVTLFGAAANALAADWAVFEPWFDLDPWVHLEPKDWELTLGFEGFNRSGDTGKKSDFEFEESLLMDQDGYILDPKIATFSLSSRVALEQGRYSEPNSGTVGETSGTRFGLFTDYDARISLLHGTLIPLTITGQATLDSGSLDGELGRRTEFTNQTNDVTVLYRNPYFPSSISYSEIYVDELSSSGLSSAENLEDSILRRLRFNGRSSKLNLQLSQDWFNDLTDATTQQEDYAKTEGSAFHTFYWGKGSSLNSFLRYQDRTGYSPNRTLSISESATLRHSSKLQSSFDYSFSNEKYTTKTITNSGAAEVVHHLYDNLTSTLRLSGSNEDSEASDEKEYDARVDFDYRKNILWNGKLTLGVGGGYGVTDRKTTEGLLEVVDESHVVPIGRIVSLERQFVETTTIVVTNLAGNITYTLGVDYTFQAAGDNHTELNILPAGLIIVGQTILVDYKVQPLPTQKFSRLPYSFNAGLDFGWIFVYQRINGEQQSLISGRDADSINNSINTTTGVEFRWNGFGGRATFVAEKTRIDTGSFRTDSFDFRQTFEYAIASDATFNANTSESFITSVDREITVYSGNATVNWRPLRGMTIRPEASIWKRKSEESSTSLIADTDDTYASAGLSVRWLIRSVDLDMRYTHNRRSGSSSNTKEHRLMLTVSRKF